MCELLHRSTQQIRCGSLPHVYDMFCRPNPSGRLIIKIGLKIARGFLICR